MAEHVAGDPSEVLEDDEREAALPCFADLASVEELRGLFGSVWDGLYLEPVVGVEEQDVGACEARERAFEPGCSFGARIGDLVAEES